MKFTNSNVPLTPRKDAVNTDNPTKWQLLTEYTTRRWYARREKLAERKRLLRAANRKYRRQMGMSLRTA